MRIWINDTQLDTYEGSVSVSKTNNLWKFGKAEFVHTQTVKIPATNNNKALLDFADEFRTQSAVARGFVDCLVEIDGVFEEGRIYVSGYSDGEFSVILTFGKELQSLDVKLVGAIKNIPAGVIINTISGFAYINVYDKDGALTEKVFTTTNYLLSLLEDNGVDVIDYDKFSVSGDGIAFESDANDIKDTGSEFDLAITRHYYGLSTDITKVSRPAYVHNISIDIPISDNVKISSVCVLAENVVFGSGTPVITKYYGRLQYFVYPTSEVELIFGPNSSEYSVILLNSELLNETAVVPELPDLIISQIGKCIDFSHGFEGVEQSGDLSGKTVLVQPDTPFIIVNYSDYIFVYGQNERDYLGGLYYRGNTSAFQLKISLPVFSAKFIPDITIYQLLQILAARRSSMIYFDGTKYTTTTLDDILDKTTAFTAKEESKSSYSVSDKAFDFAQKNTLKYKSGVLETNLYINNLHIAGEKTVLEVPFDGGTWKEVGVIAETDGGFPMYLNRNISTMNAILAALRFPYELQAILSNTRQVKVKFRMTYLDFIGTKELDNFEYKGARLQWSSLQWSDGWCTATLQTLH